MDIFVNRRIQFHLNNTINLRRLTSHMIWCYTHKMADRVITIDSVTLLHRRVAR